MIELNYLHFIFLFIASLFLNYFIFVINPKLKKSYSQIQDIHQGDPSRLGGLIIFCLFFIYEYLFLGKLIYFFFISMITVIPSFLEDLRVKINPKLRFIAIFTTSLLLVTSIPMLPQFNFGYLDIVLNNYLFQIIFYSLCMSAVINGQNIIDGTHGLSAMTSICIFCCLLFLGYYLNDLFILEVSLILILLISVFILFNYPYGKIFLGDTGSYFLGILSSYLIIYLFGKYPEIPTWSAATILFYPTLEVVFSYFRKIIQKKSPFLADNNHLHLKVYYLLAGNKKKSRLYNALVTPFLAIIWLSPLAILPFSIQYSITSLILLFALIIVYLFFYFSIPNPKDI